MDHIYISQNLNEEALHTLVKNKLISVFREAKGDILELCIAPLIIVKELLLLSFLA